MFGKILRLQMVNITLSLPQELCKQVSLFSDRHIETGELKKNPIIWPNTLEYTINVPKVCAGQ